MAKILITGGSGLIGRAISELLLKQGHEPRWLSREAGNEHGIPKFKWEVSGRFIDEKAFEGAEHIIHLAGAGIIDKRWTPAYKREIIRSRVESSTFLLDTILKNGHAIKTCIGASAIGYYGSAASDHWFTEADSPGNDFLAETCIAWEKSYEGFYNSGIRTAIIRTGIVLSRQGGAYAKMVTPFKLGLGAGIGSGRQYFSWIHIRDLARIYLFALFNEQTHGPYNAVASDAVTNIQFSQALAKSFHKPFFLPNVPTFVLKLALGERAVTITRGLKVSNEKIKQLGFAFEHDELDEALKDLSGQ